MRVYKNAMVRSQVNHLQKQAVFLCIVIVYLVLFTQIRFSLVLCWNKIPIGNNCIIFLTSAIINNKQNVVYIQADNFFKLWIFTNFHSIKRWSFHSNFIHFKLSMTYSVQYFKILAPYKHPIQEKPCMQDHANSLNPLVFFLNFS
jgi:hypothetical protein